MNKLKPEDVMKALECCSKDDCDNCPNTFGNCYSNLAKASLALLRENESLIEVLTNNNADLEAELAETHNLCDEKDAEIEKLTDDNKWSAKRIIETDRLVLTLKSEIERLKAENVALENGLEISLHQQKQIKSDIASKMQERLKQAFNFGNTILEKSICDIINQIAKDIEKEN